MSHEHILGEFPSLTEQDIFACLAYAADRERGVTVATVSLSCSMRTCRRI